MSGAAALSARLALMLTELRVPTIKRVAADLCQQSDKEGWPGQRLLEALIEHEPRMATQNPPPVATSNSST
jgi:hypothetical protein